MADATAKIVLFSVELGLTMVGNAILLVLLWRSGQLHRKGSKNFIFNCAVADLISTIINIPFAMDYCALRTGHLQGTVAPTAVTFFLLFLTLLIVSSTLLMMADRLLIVKYPVKYHCIMTVKRARFAIAAAWTSSFLMAAIVTTCRMMLNPPNLHDTTAQYIARIQQSSGKFFISVNALLILFPVTSLTVMLKRELKKLSKRKSSEAGKRQAEKQIAKSTRTVELVSMTFLACHFPLVLSALLQVAGIETPIDKNTIIFIGIFCSQLNTVLDPMLFILRSSEIRGQALKNLPFRVEGMQPNSISTLQRRRNSPTEKEQHEQMAIDTPL